MQSLMYYLSALRPCTTCGGGVALSKHCTRDTASQVPPAAGAAVADRCLLVMLCLSQANTAADYSCACTGAVTPGHKNDSYFNGSRGATAFSRSR
jgi:hypothetical protein